MRIWAVVIAVSIVCGAGAAFHWRSRARARAPELGTARTVIGLKLLREANAALPKIEAQLADGERRLAAGDRDGAWRAASEVERLLEPVYLAQWVPIPEAIARARARLDELVVRVDPKRVHFFEEELARKREHIAEELSED